MPYTSYLLKKKFGLRRHDRDTRAQLAQNFRAMYRSLGMDLPACAKFLHVSTRTVHNWESGKHDIPFATYKLLRLLNRMELPGQSWQGWCFYGNKLISPEGRSFEGKDSNWWGLLIRRSEMFSHLYKNGESKLSGQAERRTLSLVKPALFWERASNTSQTAHS